MNISLKKSHVSRISPTISDIYILVGGWPTPLKNDGLRQLGLWNSQYMESHKTCSSHHQPVYNTFFAGDGGSQSHYFLETVLSQLRSLATLERMTRLCALSCHSCNVSQTGEIPPAQPCDILVSLGHYRSPLPVTTAGHHCWSLDEIEENENNATYQYFGLNQIFLTRVAKSQALRLRRTLKQQNKQKVTFCEQVSLHERNFVNQEEARDPNLGIGWASRLNEPSSTAWRIFFSAPGKSHIPVMYSLWDHCQNIHHVAGWWLITIPN